MQRGHTGKNEMRQRRHARVRARIIGTAERPRLAIFKSNRFVSAQVIDDSSGRTLASAHGREFSAKGGPASGGKASQAVQAVQVGEAVASRAKEAGVTTVVFDRGGYQYAAQVKALADAARAGGLTF